MIPDPPDRERISRARGKGQAPSARPVPTQPTPHDALPGRAPDSTEPSAVRPPPRLLDQVREAIRVRHYSIRTETAYVQSIRRFILFHGKRHPRELGT